MIAEYLRELERRLGAVGVRGRAARRILAEAEDHLREAAATDDEDGAIQRFGHADRVAQMVAAELGVRRTCAATYWTFVALALAGIAFTIALLLMPAAGGWPDLFGGRFGGAGVVIGVALLVFPQIAFVSGCLALVRALRLRSARSAADSELRLLRRRGAVALTGTVVTLAALVAYAFDFRAEIASWWTLSVLTISLALVVPLLAAAIGLAWSARLAVTTAGRAGDVFDDLAPLLRVDVVRRLDLPEHPWRFAMLCAGAVGVAGFVGGAWAEGGPGSGLARGGFEAVALLASFAALGRPLGLRR